jgi:hypothetical protein
MGACRRGRKGLDDQDGISADPGLEKAEGSARLPDDACFACAYEDDFVVDAWDAVLFFRRTGTTETGPASARSRVPSSLTLLAT